MEICNESSFSPLTQRRVSSLINELDIIGVVNARVISLGRHGRTKKIRLGIPRQYIKDAISFDDRLEYLISYTPKCLNKITSKKIG